MSTRPPMVVVRGVSKRFGATQALDDVDLTIAHGEIHALVGENGAGKSTLGKIIGGVYRADKGVLSVDDEVVGGSWDTKRALEMGVAMIQQELSLVPALSVAENVFLGIEGHRLGMLKPGLDDRFRELNGRCGFDLPARAPVQILPIAERQKVEILRALARDARLIIMDEPTSSLTADEIGRLHDVMQWLRDQGRSIVYVSHFLDAVLEQSDAVTVMRDGRVVRTTAASAETKQSLVEAMLGQPLEVTFPEVPAAPVESTAPVLELRRVSSGPLVREVSLTVRPGEIVGLAGLVGSGRSETLRTIFGSEPLEAGEILIRGEPYRRPSPRRSVRQGLALVPEDRRDQGLVLTQPVRQNVTLPHLDGFSRSGVVTRRRERTQVGRMLERLHVVPHRVDGDVSFFSGGNQQKVLFAKWMLRRPDVILLDEPTRGVDVGAKQKIYEVIVGLAGAGAAVLLVSSELEEVMGLSHRVYLLHQGRLLGEVDPRATTVDDVLFRLFGLGDELRSDTSEDRVTP